MRLRNFYIFFPIVVSVFILFVLKYKFQNLFLSKYIISQKELSKKISNYVQNQTQSFLIFLSKNFYFFKDKLKVIWDSFKVLEDHFSKNSYKTFRFSNNESQIYEKSEVVEENLSLEEMEKDLIRRALKKHKNR